MSLRPHYSLLTLLVLTALVAGGVKLWYGPHRISVPYVGRSLIGLEKENPIPLWQDINCIVMTGNEEPVQNPQDRTDTIAFEYFRDWSSNKVATACQTWKKPRYLVRVQEPQMGSMHLILESASPPGPEMILRLTNYSSKIELIEQLSCWIAGSTEGSKIGFHPRDLPLIGSVFEISIQVSHQHLHPVYYLTTSGKIYQLVTVKRIHEPSLEPIFDLEAITIEAIADQRIRARVIEQLAVTRE